MKKFLSIIAVVIVAATLSIGLIACGNETASHTHNYSTAWSSDETGHWHACNATQGECDTPKKDEAPHTWDDGEITAAVTETADSVKTYTCTTCGKTKTEKIEYSVFVPQNGTAYVFDHFEKYDMWINGEKNDWRENEAALNGNKGSTFTFEDGKIYNYNPNIYPGTGMYTMTYEIVADKFVIIAWEGSGAVPIELIEELYFVVEENQIIFYEVVDNERTKMDVIAIYILQQ